MSWRVPIGDYHVHSGWSDGRDAVGAMVARAASLALPEVGLTDHLVPLQLDDGYGMPLDRVEDYVDEVRGAAADVSTPRVLLGVEVDFSPETWEKTALVLKRHEFDYVIGSVHSVDGSPIDLRPDTTRERWPDVDELFARYYRCITALALAGGVDVIGHLDLPKKFGRRPTSAVGDHEDGALDAIAHAGLLIEVNSAGLRVAAGEQYPSRSLLTRARERGIRITFGSDAHSPGEVGAGFAQVLEVARLVGYGHWVRLSDRAEVPLP